MFRMLEAACPGNGDQGDRIRARGVQAGDEIRGRRSGGADGQSHAARSAAISVRRVHGALFVPGDVMPDARGLEVLIDGIDGRSGDTECGVDTLVFQNPDYDFGDFHDVSRYRRGGPRLSRPARAGKRAARVDRAFGPPVYEEGVDSGTSSSLENGFQDMKLRDATVGRSMRSNGKSTPVPTSRGLLVRRALKNLGFLQIGWKAKRADGSASETPSLHCPRAFSPGRPRPATLPLLQCLSAQCLSAFDSLSHKCENAV